MASELIVQTLKGPTTGANANKVIIPSGQTLDIDAWTPPSGTLVQQEHLVYGTDTTISQESGWVTVLTTSFTPKFPNSKIYIEIDLAHGNRSSGEHQFGHRIFSSNSSSYTHALTSNNSDLYDVFRDPVGNCNYHTRYLGFEQLAMESVTAITYSFQIAQPSPSYPDIRINFAGRAKSVMTIKEIAG
jgi:hypothetical protein